MPILVEIADRQYGYTDEEKAADAVAQFQCDRGVTDAEIISQWADEGGPLRSELERVIFDAIDANGSPRRALETIPAEVILSVA